MATSLTSDFKVYQEQVATSLTETLTQNTEAITNGANGAILMSTNVTKGDYIYESFFTQATAVGRQDLTSVSAATAVKLAQAENVNVKVHRRYQYDVTRKAFKMAGLNPEVFNIVAGQQIGKEIITGMLNDGILAARVAINNVAALTNDVTAASPSSITMSNLLGTMRKFGDASSKIVAWVMHSTQFFDLAINEVSNQVSTIYEGILQRVDVPGLGRPILVTDSASLINTTPNPDQYFVLGLTAGAIQLIDTETNDLIIDDVTGLEQLVRRYQGEYAFNVGLKGFQWDVTNGGANPAAAALGTGSNWDKVVTDNKDTAGVVLQCLAA
jgi:hypothetical protein